MKLLLKKNLEKYLKKIFDVVSYTISNRLTTVLNIILLPLITPFLTLEDFGIFGVYSSIIFIISSLVPVGQNLYLDNSFFTHKKNYILVWKRCLSIMNFLSIIYIILYLIIISLYFKDNVNFIYIFIFGSIYIIFNPYDIIIRTYHIYNEESLYYLKKNSIKSIIIFLITYFLIAILKLGYLGWIVSMAIGQLLNMLIFYKIIIKNNLFPFLKLKKKWMIENIAITYKLIPYQISSQIINVSDKLILNYFNVSLGKIGMYSQGYNFGYNGKSIINGLFSAFALNIQTLFRNNNFIKIKKLLFRLYIIFSIIALNFQIWTKEIFTVLFKKKEFIESHLIAGLIFSSITFFIIYEFFNVYLLINKSGSKISQISVLVAFVNLFLNFTLIPILGITAAIITSIFTHFLLSISFLFFKETRIIFYKMLNSLNFIILFICHILLSTIIYFYYDNIPLLIKIIISASTFIFLIYKLLKFKND